MKNNLQNPTARQHILPRKTIERFYGEDKPVVHMMLFYDNKKIIPANAKNVNFISYHKWSADVEKCFGYLEDEFHCISEKIVEGGSLDANDFYRLNKFYGLLAERSKARYHNFEPDIPCLREDNEYVKRYCKSFMVCEKWGQCDIPLEICLDRLEKKGCFIDGASSERVARGMAQKLVVIKTNNCEPWGVVRTDSDFIVSDLHHEFAAIPVAPNIYLIKGEPNLNLCDKSTKELNEKIRETACKFVFSKRMETLLL